MDDQVLPNLAVSVDTLTSESYECGLKCREECDEIFSDEEDFKQCLQLLNDSEVMLVGRLKDKMRNGRWDSISERELSLMVQVSHRIWEEFSGRSVRSAKDMLTWLVEEEGVSDHLNIEVLKEALSALSYKNNDNGVIDGLSKVIEDEKTFLEFSAWENNEQAFRMAHEVILDVCRDSHCVEGIYCQQSSDIVFDFVNKLSLAQDVVEGDTFSRSHCS